MIFVTNGVFMGSEEKVSAKTGKRYNVLLFASGMETMTLMLKDDCTFDGLKGLGTLELYQPYTFTLDFNTRYNQFAIAGISTLK